MCQLEYIKGLGGVYYNRWRTVILQFIFQVTLLFLSTFLKSVRFNRLYVYLKAGCILNIL